MPLDRFDALSHALQSLPTSAHPDSVHHFADADIWAIRCAMAARRALLVRGEPGTGKSQMARAAAATLGRPFTELVVDAHATCHDLCFRFDAVERLAEAQIQGALLAGQRSDAAEREKQVRERLDPARFITPGPLWWALNWQSASKTTSRAAAPLVPATSIPAQPIAAHGRETGVVVLIDEIDKAESDVPNGLLDVLGNGWFAVPPCQGSDLGRIHHDPAQPFPLIIITTNEERDLPLAFRRRCLEHRLELPAPAVLVDRALAHFSSGDPALDRSLISRAVDLLMASRRGCQEGEPRPGQAELMDWLRTVQGLARTHGQDPAWLLEQAKPYHLRPGRPADGT